MALMKLSLPNLLLEEVEVRLFQQFQNLTAFVLILVLTTTAACGNGAAKQPTNLPVISRTGDYALLAREIALLDKILAIAVQTAKGLVQDAYVRDNNKLGVVITPQVRPNEVKPLAKSLAQGFHKNFPNQDLTVLMYAPDKN